MSVHAYSVARSVQLLVLPACMGGWCSYRDQCARHVTTERIEVVERLCAHGQEAPKPVFVVRKELVQ